MNTADLPADVPTYDPQALDLSVPVLILGGKENALSLARSYGALGISVFVSGPIDCWAMHSRYCEKKWPIPRTISTADYWANLLLEKPCSELQGSLIIPCSDLAIEFVANNRRQLAKNHILDHANAKMQLALLDKRETLVMAKRVGVATPGFWDVETEEDLENIRATVQFPVMVKPVLSHEFIKIFGCKLFIIENDFDLLAQKVRLSRANHLEVMIVEMIPGPDSLLSSYNTYVDSSHDIRFEYTKSIIRRYPVNRGLACFHKSEWLPRTAEAGKKFFTGIKFTGLGNIEFKLDPRDNVLKVIESNARFTAAQELIIRSGAPTDLIYYCCATGQPSPTFDHYTEHMTYWYGPRDLLAFIEMRKMGKITTDEWLKSILSLRHVPPLHNLADPYPSIGALGARIDKTLRASF